MSEEPSVPVQPDDGAKSEPTGDSDAGRHGKVRTDGETAVDEAMGSGGD